MAHNIRGPHDAVFYKLLDELKEECQDLMDRGVSGTGAGFDAKSMGRLGGRGPVPIHNPDPRKLREVAVQAAEDRARKHAVMYSGPRTVGGGSSDFRNLTPAQAAARAAERRVADEKWCASAGMHSGANVEDAPAAATGTLQVSPPLQAPPAQHAQHGASLLQQRQSSLQFAAAGGASTVLQSTSRGPGPAWQLGFGAATNASAAEPSHSVVNFGDSHAEAACLSVHGGGASDGRGHIVGGAPAVGAAVRNDQGGCCIDLTSELSDEDCEAGPAQAPEGVGSRASGAHGDTDAGMKDTSAVAPPEGCFPAQHSSSRTRAPLPGFRGVQAEDSPPWTCTVCTLVNAATAAACGACEAPSPQLLWAAAAC